MDEKKKFSVGLAFYDVKDSDGVFPELPRVVFTVMSLLTHHPLVGEVIVVDNNPLPDNPVRNFLPKCGGRASYVEFPEPKGTSAPRNEVFRRAKYDRVACVDAHVLLYPGFFESLDRFYEGHGEDCPDLLHGPLVTEAGVLYGTHMNDQWRAHMWGTWGRAWQGPDGRQFSCLTRDDRAVEFVTLGNTMEGEQTPLEFPEKFGWAGHETVLRARGCVELHDKSEPFEIPGHGMGFFACRREAWLPFHDGCRGFGGEEMTTHLRFRRAGRKAWCVPGAKWWHHFERPFTGTRGGQGAPYRLTLYDRVRNYCLEFSRLGMDLAPVRTHFDRRVMSEPEWRQASAGLDWPTTPGAVPQDDPRGVNWKPQGTTALQTTTPPPPPTDLDSVYRSILARRGNVSDDAQALRELAATCGEGGRPGRVVEFGTNQGAAAACFLHARPELLVTFDYQHSPQADLLSRLASPDTFAAIVTRDPAAEQIPDCDLLFINIEPHHEENVRRLLEAHHKAAGHYLALHGTNVYGEKWNHLPGVLPAVRAFLKEHREWHACRRMDTPSGLTVLSRDPADPSVSLDPLPPGPPAGAKPVPAEGPGTELKKILSSVGIEPSADCDCKGKMMMMNAWGVKGCRQNFNTIVGWMRDGAERWGWAAAVLGMAKHPVAAVKLAAKVNWKDPFPGLVTLAVDEAEKNG